MSCGLSGAPMASRYPPSRLSVYLRLDLLQGRPRMLCSPGAHPAQHFLAQPRPLLGESPLRGPSALTFRRCSLLRTLSYASSLLHTTTLRNSDAHPIAVDGCGSARVLVGAAPGMRVLLSELEVWQLLSE